MYKIKLNMVKEPDLWQEVKKQMCLSDEEFFRVFECGDYADIEIEFDKHFNITGGRFIQRNP